MLNLLQMMMIDCVLNFNELGIIQEFIMSRVFNEEKVKELNDELELTLLSIGKFMQDRNYHISQNGSDLFYKVLEDLKVEKIKLELKIDTLVEYLNGDK